MVVPFWWVNLLGTHKKDQPPKPQTPTETGRRPKRLNSLCTPCNGSLHVPFTPKRGSIQFCPKGKVEVGGAYVLAFPQILQLHPNTRRLYCGFPLNPQPTGVSSSTTPRRIR